MGALILPITRKKDLTSTPQEWSYLYAYNLRTLRDIFIYCAAKKEIKEKILYEDLAKMIIPPPKNSWVTDGIKRADRLRLEYIHSAEYLGLITRDDGVVRPNLETFSKEKAVLICESRGRNFYPGLVSPPLSDYEKEALLKIVFNYQRARDFLHWFLDFKRYPNNSSFSIQDFINDAKPIWLLSGAKKGLKGSNIVKRESDGLVWEIPSTKPEDYIRLASYVFPSWFQELGLIDRVVIFPEFSDDKKLWYVYYPIKMKEQKFLSLNFKKILIEKYLTKTSSASLWIPRLVYDIVKEYNCPRLSVHKAIERVYREDSSHYYLDRASLRASLIRGNIAYIENYLKVDGFYRSTLKIFR